MKNQTTTFVNNDKEPQTQHKGLTFTRVTQNTSYIPGNVLPPQPESKNQQNETQKQEENNKNENKSYWTQFKKLTGLNLIELPRLSCCSSLFQPTQEDYDWQITEITRNWAATHPYHSYNGNLDGKIAMIEVIIKTVLPTLTEEDKPRFTQQLIDRFVSINNSHPRFMNDKKLMLLEKALKNVHNLDIKIKQQVENRKQPSASL